MSDGRTKIVQLCANRCVLSGNECDAFYIRPQDDGTECHLTLETEVNRTIGFGQDKEDIYYVKLVTFIANQYKKKLLQHLIALILQLSS